MGRVPTEYSADITDFNSTMHEFSISGDVEEMDEGDLRSTLDEFMEKHDENVAEYGDVQDERDEYSEKVDALEAEVSDFQETETRLADTFAEVVASETDLFDADEVADRFSLGELINKADALGAFSLATDADEGEADDDGTFDEKPEKAPVEGSSGGSSFTEEAEADLQNLLGVGQ